MKTAQKNSQLDAAEAKIVERLTDAITDPRLGGGDVNYALALQYAIKIVQTEAKFARGEL